MVVQHNLTAMNSNRMLGLTMSSQAKSTEKLSSGYKINRAADDAAGLSISEKMRKQIRGLSQASLNAQDGISAVQTAEGALTEVHDMLQRMNELAVKAANGTNSEDDRQYIQDEINQLITEIDRVAETTKFNETYLLKGNGSSVGDEITPTIKDAGALTALTPTPVQAEADVYTTGVLAGTITAGDAVYTVEYMDKNGNVKTKDIAFKTTTAADTTADAFIAAANGDADLGALFDVDGDNNGITFTARTAGADQGRVLSVTVKSASGSTLAAGTRTTTGADAYNTYDLSDAVDGDGDTITIGDKTYTWGNVAHASNGVYNDFATLQELAAADGYIISGTEDAATIRTESSALDLSLHVGADSTDENQISLQIDAMDATSLGLKTGSMEIDGESVKTLLVNGSDDANARAAIDTISAAIQKVSTQRSALGAVQNRLEHTINNLDNVVENTTAAESQIRDTDMATEMVKYSNNQILAQAGQAMLAQANQANQGVLSLLS